MQVRGARPGWRDDVETFVIGVLPAPLRHSAVVRWCHAELRHRVVVMLVRFIACAMTRRADRHPLSSHRGRLRGPHSRPLDSPSRVLGVAGMRIQLWMTGVGSAGRGG